MEEFWPVPLVGVALIVWGFLGSVPAMIGSNAAAISVGAMCLCLWLLIQIATPRS